MLNLSCCGLATERLCSCCSSPALLLPGHLHVDADGGSRSVRDIGQSVCGRAQEETPRPRYRLQLWYGCSTA